MGFSKNPLTVNGFFENPTYLPGNINETLKSKMAENRHLKNRYGSMNCADWCRMISKQTAVICLKSKPEIKFQYSGHLGEFKCISHKKTNACNVKFAELSICGLMGTGVKQVKVCCRKCHIWNRQH